MTKTGEERRGGREKKLWPLYFVAIAHDEGKEKTSRGAVGKVREGSREGRRGGRRHPGLARSLKKAPNPASVQSG